MEMLLKAMMIMTMMTFQCHHRRLQYPTHLHLRALSFHHRLHQVLLRRNHLPRPKAATRMGSRSRMLLLGKNVSQ